ncbi:uncharacterized protein LOC117216041, partial [Bombus bifarius]|uniref:Uncharacterized protein LOC117216041 n=1 Tax=Bombus bifarius TaxID=103933 RepID=A0A6P8MX24_9HYME
MLTLINKEAPDMVLISETKLNKRHNVHFKNYSMIRHDRPNASQGEGTAILIKNPIKYKTILIDKITSFKTLETTIIKIKISNKENLFITAAYATYGNQKEFNYEFNNLFKLLQLNKPENYYIIAGDLNAKHTSWKNEINNTRGNFIRNWLDNKSIHYKTNLYSSELPSYPKGGSYLDICLADARLKFQNLPPNNTLKTLAYDSDHNALVFHVNKNTSDFLTLETQTETPREELEFLKYLLYRIKAQLKQEFANSINHYWTNKIKNISKNNSANMFPQINQIFRPKEQNPIPPLKLPSENASLIQEAGITIHNTIKDTEDDPKQPDPEINYFTNYNQLNTIFSKLNNKKSSGFNGIPNILLKRLPNKIKWYYTVLFNNALNNTYFPGKWKKAKLIAITKKDKDGSSPANLRPIKNQFGFRHKHSTIHAINKLTSDICWALNAKQRVAACLIDLEKAFDTVWIPGLIYKLIKKNFPKYLIKIVWDMITSRTFVMTEGSHSSSKEFSIKNGLQQ